MENYQGHVSIHASAREATTASALVLMTVRLFQSTPPHGRRLLPVWRANIPSLFQSTPPHGRRHCSDQPAFSMFRCFNPRLRTGGDFVPPGAPAHSGCFNPRLRTGGDAHCAGTVHLSPRRFNPRLRTGGDLEGVTLDVTLKTVSIHASAREATWWGTRFSWPWTSFNPRLRTGGDWTSLKQRV